MKCLLYCKVFLSPICCLGALDEEKRKKGEVDRIRLKGTRHCSGESEKRSFLASRDDDAVYENYVCVFNFDV